jgi:hypothetical protein
MGSRTMSSGWLDVAPGVIEDDTALMSWLDVARESTGSAVEATEKD